MIVLKNIGASLKRSMACLIGSRPGEIEVQEAKATN